MVSAHGRHVIVETTQGERVHCHTRGKRSELVVGDLVQWETSGDQGVITRMVDRRNVLYRQDEWKTKTFAANLDQVLLIVAVEPPFSDTQLTRSLVAIADAGLPAHIICNKIDLPQTQATLQRLKAYASTEVDILPLALKPRSETGAGASTGASAGDAHATLMPLLQGRVTLVIGPSGVGKSTLINLMVPNAEAQVGEISQALNAGKHTTTATRWYWLDAHQRDTALIDTPGFQQFGLKHIEPDRLAGLMPDIQKYATACRFYNCTHRHEPGCGVLEAVKRGEIPARRHDVYVELLGDSGGGAGAA